MHGPMNVKLYSYIVGNILMKHLQMYTYVLWIEFTHQNSIVSKGPSMRLVGPVTVLHKRFYNDKLRKEAKIRKLHCHYREFYC
jgi:hypothetical protein